MKYYEEHEQAYQSLIKNGYIAWDKQKSITELLSLPFANELDHALAGLPKASQVIDLGCGTGRAALFLAKQGYRATGIDISQTAITKARELARELNLPVEYHCDDLLSANLGNFDAALDTSLLHCIVFDDDRAKVFAKIASLLRPGGILVVHTMVSDRAFDFGSNFELDGDGILWYLAHATSVDEAREHARGKASPQRRIRRSEEIKSEITKHGFAEISSTFLYEEMSGPLTLFAAFRLA